MGVLPAVAAVAVVEVEVAAVTSIDYRAARFLARSADRGAPVYIHAKFATNID